MEGDTIRRCWPAHWLDAGEKSGVLVRVADGVYDLNLVRDDKNDTIAKLQEFAYQIEGTRGQ